MIQLFNRLIIMDVSNWETNCHIKWQFCCAFCRFVILYSISSAYLRVQVRSDKYIYPNDISRKLVERKNEFYNWNYGWKMVDALKPAFWLAFWRILQYKPILKSVKNLFLLCLLIDALSWLVLAKFQIIAAISGREIKKQGRIHGNPVADSWAGAVVRKPLGIKKC